MNNRLKNQTIFNLIKLNLKVCKISRIMVLSTIFFLFISYKVIEPLNEFSLKNNLNINMWDGFFKVVTYPIIIICIYFIFVIIITSITNVKIGHNQYLIVRSKKKFLWVISRLISNLFIGLLLTTIFFLSVFIISCMFFNFDPNWSSTITNPEISMKLMDVLYLSNFVFSLTPVQATIISFLEVFIATAIIISCRDLFIDLCSNIYICDLIVTIYIFISIVNYMYKLNIGIFNYIKYISLDVISIISFHKFDNIKIYDITLTQSFIVSIIFLFTLIAINLIISRNLEVECD